MYRCVYFCVCLFCCLYIGMSELNERDMYISQLFDTNNFKVKILKNFSIIISYVKCIQINFLEKWVVSIELVQKYGF